MVPCKCCSSDKLDFTTKEVNSILRDGVINVSLRYREGYWDPIDQLTLEEAIEKVPQDYRSPLRIIQFLNKEGYNEMWTWRGLDVEKEWGDINFWVKSTDDNTIIDEVHLKDGAVTTKKIADNAVTFRKLAEDAKGVIIPYGTSADIVKEHLKTYRGQTGRLGLYVADSALGNVPAINSEGNIIRAVSIVKSTGHDDYVDVFILVFDGSKWSRQTYSQVGRVPGNDAVTTPKIANEAVTDIKLAPLSVGASHIKGFAVTTPKIANGSVTSDKIADGAVTTPKIVDKAVVKGKLSEDLQEVLDNAGTKAIRINYDDVEAAKKAIADYNADPNKTVVLVNYSGIRIPAIMSDTYNPVIVAYLPEGINVHKLLFQGDAWSETVIYGDNVRYNNQTLTATQKAQARKNIDVDYLTEDEVTNLWDTTK